MPKETYDTDVKRKVIEKQRDMIRKHLVRGPKKKRPEDIKVAFFPGKEALEYAVAYESLGIPQENVTAIERYAPNFEYWKKNSDFQMTDAPVDAKEFFANYKGEPFDVISLDYDGMLNWDVVDTVDDIASRGLLNERGVFATNLYAKREQDVTKQLYINSIEGLLFGAKNNPELKNVSDADVIMQKNRGFGRDKADLSLNGDGKWEDTRDTGITFSILNGFVGGASLGELGDMYLRSPLFKFRNDEIEKRLDKIPTEELEKVGREKSRIMLHYGISNTDFIRELGETLEKNGHTHLIAPLLLYLDSDRYFPQEIQSFKYTGDNGAIMFTDMFALDKKVKVLKKYKKLHETIFTSAFPVGPGGRLGSVRYVQKDDAKAHVRGLKAYVKRVSDDRLSLAPRNSKNDLANLPPRVDLGSSRKPSIRSKSKLREVVRSGLSAEEIGMKYNVSDSVRGSLPAFIAHRTMETYKPSVKEEREVVVKNKKAPKEEAPNFNFQMMPRKEYKALVTNDLLSDNAKLRMKYFEQDTRGLSDSRRVKLSESLVESGWSKDLSRSAPSDLEIYAFFDDVMMNFVHSKKRLSPEKIRSTWDKVLGSSLYEVVPFSKMENPVKKNKPAKLSSNKNDEIYKYIQAGFSDEDVMQEFGLTKRQLGARKAWVTMRG